MAQSAEFRSQPIDEGVIELFALVGDGFVGAVEAFLYGDQDITSSLLDRERRIDELYRSLQAKVSDRLTQGPLDPVEVQYLVGVIRIIPELERSGDLSEHIARKAAMGLAADMSPRCRGIVKQMADLAAAMWTQASMAYEKRDPSVADLLDQLDESLDDLHVSFIAEVASSRCSLTTAMELTLIGRFLERLGDHAVNLARTTASLVTRVDPYPKQSGMGN